MEWSDDDERVYRASRFCKTLGNPKTFEIVKALRRIGPASPSALAAELERSYGTICVHLRHLREIDVVRCWKERKGNRTVYALSTPETGRILSAIESLFGPPERQASPGKKRKNPANRKK